jgi:hypothetical protein
VAENDGQVFSPVFRKLPGEIHTSPDGQVWTKQASHTTRDLLRVVGYALTVRPEIELA